MGNLDFDPYVPPAVSAEAPLAPSGSTAELLGVKFAARSLATSGVVGAVVGVYEVLSFDAGLRRFGGLEYTPRVLFLAALRELGPVGATWVPLLAAAVVLDRAGRRAAGAASSTGRPLWIPAATVLAALPLVVAAAILAGGAVWCWDAARTAREFVDRARQIEGVGFDALEGVAKTVASALVVVMALPRAAPHLASPRWRLVAKLAVVSVLTLALDFVVTEALSVWM
jgi:hypothetical protein